MNRVGDRLRAELGVPWNGDWPHPTLVMGIVNVTPDSFQSEGRAPDAGEALAHALRLVDEGADIIDIGGESTRPGSAVVSVEDEIARVAPVIEALASKCSVPISVDTRKAAVADAALAAGARIVNDVSACRYDDSMIDVVSGRGAFVCLMHAPLDVSSMKWSPDERDGPGDIVDEVRTFLDERGKALVRAGVDPQRIWLDPGFGFGKSPKDNLRLLRCVGALVALGRPVLVGTSRKSTLGAVLGGVAPEERVEASVATAVIAAGAGAAIVRAHDVLATVRALRTADAILYG